MPCASARTSYALFCACLIGACGSDPESTTDPNAMGGAPSTPLAGTGATPGAAGTAAMPGASAGTGSAAPGTAGGGATAGTSSTAGGGATAGAGGTSAAGAAGGGAPASGAGGYVMMGDWKGYAFTSASGMGSMISPMNFDMRQAGQPLCAMGTVAALEDYSGTALLGVNVNQPMGMGAPMTVVPSKAGVFVQVTNKASSALRVQIQGPNGSMDANDRWCAPIAGTSAFIPWAMFNTECWEGGMGTAYAMQPIVAAMVLVPGGNMTPVMFDFCVDALMPADGPTGGAMPAAGSGAMPAAGSGAMPAAGSGAMMPPAAGTMGGAAGMSAGAAGTGSMVTPGANSGSGMLTDKYGAAMVMRDGRSYFVQNNVWGDNAQQTLKYDGTTFEITQQTGSNVASGGSAMGPVSYPSSFIGSNHDRATTGSNLPKQVSALSTVKTGWSNNANSGISGLYNAAYDVWFSTGAGGDPGSPSGGFLMVWYWKPSGAQPIGSVQGAPVTIPGVSGQWEVWVGQNGGKPCISYVRTQPIESLDFDLNAFIKHSTSQPGGINASWYLTNVFAGFEIWSGGVGLKTTAFYAIVE